METFILICVISIGVACIDELKKEFLNGSSVTKPSLQRGEVEYQTDTQNQIDMQHQINLQNQMEFQRQVETHQRMATGIEFGGTNPDPNLNPGMSMDMYMSMNNMF